MGDVRIYTGFVLQLVVYKIIVLIWVVLSSDSGREILSVLTFS